MLTKDILFGMNILTLTGFVVMGLTLTLNRMGPGRQGREYRPHGRRHCSGLPWAVRRGLVGIGHRVHDVLFLVVPTRMPPPARLACPY